MRKFLLAGLVVALLIAFGTPPAMAGDGNQYANQTGFIYMVKSTFAWMFQWQRDDDGDGIPNGQDEDYVPPQDGAGYQIQHRNDGFMFKSSEDALKQRIRQKLQDGSCLE
jgi:hypothetical protein